MTKANKQLILLAGAGALAYYFFVHKKSEETSEFSNIGGRRRRRKYDKWSNRLEAFCRRHPNSPQCQGLVAGGGGSTGAVAQGNLSGFSNVGGYYSSQEFCLDHYGQGNNHGVSYEMCRNGHHEPDGRGIRGGGRAPQAKRRR
tara:strand:- start:241 stop:669 length:429 start_codon:yes stop_codon:yes gene_type:complete